MSALDRVLEPEWMDDEQEARVYGEADFREVNARFVADLLGSVALDRALALDLGCGPADIPLRLHRERPGWRIAAVDAAAAMLDLARRAIVDGDADQRISLVRAAAQRLPFKDRSANVIFSNSLLHHLPDPLPLWREINRIARPGAAVFVRDLMRPASQEAAREIVQQNAGAEPRLLQDEFYRSLLAAFTPQEVRAQLDASGLTHFEVIQASDRHLDVRGVTR